MRATDGQGPSPVAVGGQAVLSDPSSVSQPCRPDDGADEDKSEPDQMNQIRDW